MAVNKKRLINILYDIFTAIISILDVVTDILVTMDFFFKGRTEFGIASLVILGVAQVAYAIAFWFKFDSSFESFGGAVAAFCCLLPFSPILSFAFYFTASEDTALYQCLSSLYSCRSCTFPLGTASHHSSNNNGGDAELEALREWMKEKLSKHLGFIIEAMVEAFPQSILQLSAIVYFGDTDNYLSIASILLSMLSVSSKSLILSVTVSHNWKCVFFNWLSALSDFFGVFFIASFAFYVPPHLHEGPSADSNPFELISSIWLGLLLLTVVPFGLVGSVGINLNVCWKALVREHLNSCIVVFVQIAWAVGLCITVMAMSISCHLWLAAALYAGGFTKRVPGKSSQPFFLALISWIDGAHRIRIVDPDDERMNVTVRPSQDRVIRICTVNRVLLDRVHYGQNRVMRYDRDLHQYLIAESTARDTDCAYSYESVTLRSLKEHTSKHREKSKEAQTRWALLSRAWEKVRREVSNILDRLLVEEHFQWVVVHCCTPLYIMGRCVHLTFAALIVLYLIFGHDIHIFTADIPAFQTAMFVTYLGLVVLWMVSLRMMWKEIECASYILPSSTTLYDGSGYRRSAIPVEEQEAFQEIMRHYEGIVIEPLATKYCERMFGRDIAALIMVCGLAVSVVGFDYAPFLCVSSHRWMNRYTMDAVRHSPRIRTTAQIRRKLIV